MPKKSTDPFMRALWGVLLAEDLGPGGNRTGWDETPVRIRNRFIAAVRQVLQSGAAFQASAIGLGPPKPAGGETTRRPARRAKAKRHDPRELQLPLMSSLQPRELETKKRGR